MSSDAGIPPSELVEQDPNSPHDSSRLATMPSGEIQSCFLPGTQIQFAWDSTSLELFKRCPRLYQYVMIEGWQTRGEAIHLRWGIEFHQALHDYETYKALDLNHDEAVHGTVKDLLTRIFDWDPDARTASEEKKSKKNLVTAVIWYLDKFKDDAAKTVILENGKPALEVSFRFELDWGPEEQSPAFSIKPGFEPGDIDLRPGAVNYVDPTTLLPLQREAKQPYLLCGHLDRIVDYLDGLYVMDRKSASASLTQYYFAQYQPHNQMSLYALAGKVVLESPIRGVIIDAVAVGEQPEFQRGVTYRTQDQLDEWLFDLEILLREAESYATQGYWRMNDTSCDKYGGCKFREICKKSPAARATFLKADFTQLAPEDRWNPLKPR